MKELPNEQFIVATDNGIFHKMKSIAGNKRLIEAPVAGVGATCESCAHCPWMAMNSLHNLAEVLEHGLNEVILMKPSEKEQFVPWKECCSLIA